MLINRLLLFLGLLGVMILLAGFLFSRGDRAVSTAQAESQSSALIKTDAGNRVDSLMQSSERISSQPENK